MGAPTTERASRAPALHDCVIWITARKVMLPCDLHHCVPLRDAVMLHEDMSCNFSEPGVTESMCTPLAARGEYACVDF
jgi:hypothetical protein